MKQRSAEVDSAFALIQRMSLQSKHLVLVELAASLNFTFTPSNMLPKFTLIDHLS